MKEEKWDCIINFPIKRKEKKLPKTWKEFCEMTPKKGGEYLINAYSTIVKNITEGRRGDKDKNNLPDRATAEAVLALCQLIQLRNCYNGDWVPDWTSSEAKFIIYFNPDGNAVFTYCCNSADLLFFKNEKLCGQFLQNFRYLIEKLKPLYGIKEGGEE